MMGFDFVGILTSSPYIPSSPHPSPYIISSLKLTTITYSRNVTLLSANIVQAVIDNLPSMYLDGEIWYPPPFLSSSFNNSMYYRFGRGQFLDSQKLVLAFGDISWPTLRYNIMFSIFFFCLLCTTAL